MKKILTGLIYGLCTLVLLGGCTPEQVDFSGLSSEITVSTTAVSGTGQTTATSGVEVSTAFPTQVLRKGVCWGVSPEPTTAGNTGSGGTGSGAAVVGLNGLVPATAYYVRAYAVTAQEVIYGNTRTFTTLGYQAATVSTAAIGSITQTTAAGGGTVSAAGGGAVTSRGICWNTSGSPAITGSHTSDGSGTGTFASTLSGLSAGTLYYVRAYATNQAGTAYGNQVSFSTAAVTLPVMGGLSVTGTTQTTVTYAGSITAAGGGTVTARGICWNTTGSPVVTGNHSNDGSGTGSFTGMVAGLSPGATYYLRAYATNQAGTSYSTQLSVTTLPVQLATVGSVTVTAVTRNSATGNATVSADGGGTITARGLCWSSSTSTPTVSNASYLSAGTGTGTVNLSMTGLVSGTTYYVRAFATNQAGTVYSNVVSFRTL